MIIWDLEGFSSVSKTRSSYLLGSNGFIYVFDVTRSVTDASLDEEIDFITKKYPNITLKIIGNKCDEKDSTTIEKHLKSKNINVHSFVSAKTGDGVNQLFNDIALNISSL